MRHHRWGDGIMVQKSKSEQSREDQGKPEQTRAEQRRTTQSRKEQSRKEQSGEERRAQKSHQEQSNEDTILLRPLYKTFRVGHESQFKLTDTSYAKKRYFQC